MRGDYKLKDFLSETKTDSQMGLACLSMVSFGLRVKENLRLYGVSELFRQTSSRGVFVLQPGVDSINALWLSVPTNS
ncbi:unnamed protein product [Dovyalis caffra]|uniref:Uncharacterized protein n=1 Tax=Dovyalis caffra TaxID=77055 RepID=A0AAV1QVM9_9ROSI|nr:unnamed protein product [Dovyalis caffra]